MTILFQDLLTFSYLDQKLIFLRIELVLDRYKIIFTLVKFENDSIFFEDHPCDLTAL